MWTYYKEDFPNGIWSLFRKDADRRQETFHCKNGWQSSNQLSERRWAGEIDHDDIITEEKAEALIRSLGTAG